MATPVPSPHKAITIAKGRPTSPLAPPPPPKPMDLNSSTRSTDMETGQKATRRAFHCDVVVEGEGEETANFLLHLGRPLATLVNLPAPPFASPSCLTSPLRLSIPPEQQEDETAESEYTAEQREEESRRLCQLVEELVSTERSYLSRIRALKESYADKLRTYARDPSQMILPLYEAKALFANIDNIVSGSAAFYVDLEELCHAGEAESRIGDVCLKHLKELRTFEPYRVYLSKQDESQKMLQDGLKKYPGFGVFIDRTKYQTIGIGNIGLRELLMEPVQRIPRYTLLWHAIVKCMAPLSPQRDRLFEAIEIASRIAKCEPDPQTIRATVMYCLERNVEGFPANMFSNNRDYVDSIDVEDIPADYPLASSPMSRHRSHSRPMSMTSNSTLASIPSLASFTSSASSSQLATSTQSSTGNTVAPLHCSLFLFNDKLMIVKRQSSAISGRKVTGLDDVPRLVKTGGGVAILDKTGAKRDKLSYRGLVDVLDVIASDVGNGDFHLYFERPPIDQSERWSTRPFRFFTTVHPPFAMCMDPVATRKDMMRFIENLWATQAQARLRMTPSTGRLSPRALMSSEETVMESAGEMFGRAKCFCNILDRRAWSGHPKKAKVAIHVDEDGIAQDLPRSEEGTPCMIVRLQPMAGGLCRFSYMTSAGDGGERTVIDVGEVMSRIVTTIHRYGIFRFRMSTISAPTTPSSTAHRLRPSMLNLDAISRNLFGTGSVSSRSQANTTDSSEIFGTTSTKKSKSGLSRSSTLETDSRLSIETAKTASMEAEKDKPRAFGFPSDDPSQRELIAGTPYGAVGRLGMGQSEFDLNERLNLARKNSKSMAMLSPKPSGARKLGSKSVAELRSQVEIRQTTEQAEEALREALRFGSPTPMSPTAPLRVRNKSPSPVKASSSIVDSSRSRQELMTVEGNSLPRGSTTADAALVASPRQMGSPPPQPSNTAVTGPLSPRPQGPRSPVPKALISTPKLGSAHTRLRVLSGGGRRVSAGRETIPLKGDENSSPSRITPTVQIAYKRQHSEDQLQPRKRSPSRSPLEPRIVDPSQILPEPLKVPSLSKRSGSSRSSGVRTPRRSSGPLTTPRMVSSETASIQAATGATGEDEVMSVHADVQDAIEAARQKIIESRAIAKRLKSEVQGLRKQLSKEALGRDLSARLDRTPSLPRSPQRRNINRLIDLNPYDQTSASSRKSAVAHSSRFEVDNIVMEECARGISSFVDRLEGQLKQALADGDQAVVLTRSAGKDRDWKLSEVERLQAQVNRAKGHQDLLKQQLTDVQVEVDVIYEAFNTELDGMFTDTNLPSTEAFAAMRRDLQLAKAKRNELALENMKLKRDLEEANLKREQWAQILRTQGVIP